MSGSRIGLRRAHPAIGLGFRFGSKVTNVSVGNDKVYFQDGLRIYTTSPTLTNLSLFHVNGAETVDFAVNVGGNAYYESFGSQIVAIELRNPSHLLGYWRGTNISNVMVGDGNVYFQDGKHIMLGNTRLSSVSVFHNNGLNATDIALLPPSQAVVPASATATDNPPVSDDDDPLSWDGPMPDRLVVPAPDPTLPVPPLWIGVDEPPSLGLLALGLVVAGLRRRRFTGHGRGLG